MGMGTEISAFFIWRRVCSWNKTFEISKQKRHHVHSYSKCFAYELHLWCACLTNVSKYNMIKILSEHSASFLKRPWKKYTSKCSQTNRKMNMNKCLFKNPFKYSMKGFLLPTPLPFFEKKIQMPLVTWFSTNTKMIFFLK